MSETMNDACKCNGKGWLMSADGWPIKCACVEKADEAAAAKARAARGCPNGGEIIDYAANLCSCGNMPGCPHVYDVTRDQHALDEHKKEAKR